MYGDRALPLMLTCIQLLYYDVIVTVSNGICMRLSSLHLRNETACYLDIACCVLSQRQVCSIYKAASALSNYQRLLTKSWWVDFAIKKVVLCILKVFFRQITGQEQGQTLFSEVLRRRLLTPTSGRFDVFCDLKMKNNWRKKDFLPDQIRRLVMGQGSVGTERST